MVLASADFTFLTVIQLCRIEIERPAGADNPRLISPSPERFHCRLPLARPPGVMKRLTQRERHIALREHLAIAAEGIGIEAKFARGK